MAVKSVIVLACFMWIAPSLQAPPFIANQPITWNLFEGARNDTLVGCFTCVHPVSVSVSFISAVAIQPGTFQQCTSCFTVRQISPVSDYCLFYYSNAEKLQFSKAQRYAISVECSDGTENAQAIADVRIIPNAAPVFTGPLSVTCPTPIDAVTTAANQDVYTDVVATDVNGDTIQYSMTSFPVNDVFDIEPSTGKIYTLLPVSRFCYHTVIFYVTITDNETPPTGPLTITCGISNYFTSPLVSNANREHYVDEDLVIGDGIYTFLTPPSPLPVTYTISSVQPISANSLFTFTGNSLQVAGYLNYEDVFKRSPNVTITASNGVCPPVDCYLHVHFRDKNDRPKATPKAVTHTQAEGTVITLNLDTAFAINDEDVEDDIFDYTIVAGNPANQWTVTAAHDLISTMVWDRETHGQGTTLTLEVADRKGPAFDTITVTIVVTDINDSPPTFTSTAFSFTVTECDPPERILGNLVATDADSNLNNNNNIVFDIVNMNNIGVNPAGQVTLLSNLSVGMTPSVSVGAKDLGTPSLTSPFQTTVSLIVTVCPPPTTPAPSTVATDSPCNGSPHAALMDSLWAQIATLLAAFLH